MQTLFRGLEAAFAFFGGVPRELLFDQMSGVVTDDLRDAGGVRAVDRIGLKRRARSSCDPPRARGILIWPHVP